MPLHPDLTGSKFTPVQRKIMDLLSDGRPHTVAELCDCLWDDQAAYSTVRVHIMNIRKILRPKGHDLVVTRLMARQIAYQHVMLLPSAVDGRT